MQDANESRVGEWSKQGLLEVGGQKVGSCHGPQLYTPGTVQQNFTVFVELRSTQRPRAEMDVVQARGLDVGPLRPRPDLASRVILQPF